MYFIVLEKGGSDPSSQTIDRYRKHFYDKPTIRPSEPTGVICENTFLTLLVSQRNRGIEKCRMSNRNIGGQNCNADENQRRSDDRHRVLRRDAENDS